MRAQRISIAVVVLVTAAIAHPLCNLLFRCGCAFTGPAHCNVHHDAGPRCPWCTASWHFVLAGAVWLAGAWLGIRLARRWWGPGALATFAGGMCGVLAGALVSGAATVALTGYPHFLWY